MFKPLKLSGIIFITTMFTFGLFFSVLQACVVLPGKPFDGKCKGEACVYQYAKKAKIIKVSCDVCDSSGMLDTTEDVVLNIRDMTCAGCEVKIKKTLSAYEGVSDVNVNYKSGKAELHREEGEGKASIDDLIDALEHVGFKVSQG
ncbi:MAG: heavy-metal-associated domain-containing protein [Candidatus Scalindua sp.]|jgi:copper chaperone CopZ|nr:heavy-metal-associated domain-containing protein [Candidatus Scalindua sp.]MBT5304463.1 heavy-metal-associated domain-containing protein [Candidatus Scalindua sp.]MBT6045529.1 heavy-metal-associated domain-containing protein [Candidatus Scalindua sp.]MBT6227885.1 heavy-metal-associated domain-containing protein [Candidatus Scalindua sp.]MBT6563760.1 heavy-metal-associated domain-containing protein [Candidatus Scalindua sp.]